MVDRLGAVLVRPGALPPTPAGRGAGDAGLELAVTCPTRKDAAMTMTTARLTRTVRRLLAKVRPAPAGTAIAELMASPLSNRRGGDPPPPCARGASATSGKLL